MIDEIAGAGRVGTRWVHEPACRHHDRKQREKKFASLYHREVPSIGSQRSDKGDISRPQRAALSYTPFVHDEQLISQHATPGGLSVNGVVHVRHCRLLGL